MQTSANTDGPRRGRFGAALRIALVLPALAACAAWIVQRQAAFPIGTRGASLTALVFVAGPALALVPASIGIYRLTRFPHTRTALNGLLLSVAFIVFLFAVLVGTALVVS